MTNLENYLLIDTYKKDIKEIKMEIQLNATRAVEKYFYERFKEKIGHKFHAWYSNEKFKIDDGQLWVQFDVHTTELGKNTKTWTELISLDK